MSYEVLGRPGLDYRICGYDGSRLRFRGPRADLSKPFVAFLGTTQTFGKCVARPFPNLLEAHLPASSVNFGLINGGVDAYLKDPAVLELAKKAELRVVQVIGALNLSNHYFKVHPRRNDRFIRAHSTLRKLFPEVDFTEFHFTGAMLNALRGTSIERYSLVCDELQKIWLARMTVLLQLLGERTILFWFASAPPPVDAVTDPSDPVLVDADMIERMRAKSSAYVQIVPDERTLRQDRDYLAEVAMQSPAAQAAMGPAAHFQAAQALQETCAHLLGVY